MDNEFKKQVTDLSLKGLKRTDSIVEDKLNLSSNDYLGLSHHPYVLNQATEAMLKYGVGGTSSRLLAGTQKIHQDLENALAAFLSKQVGLVFSSGYHVNTGIIPVLVGQGDLILVDELCHASIIDGVRLSSARFATFRHNDTSHLAQLLSKRRSRYHKTLIISEGIFSMDGDICPIRNIVQLAKEFDAMTYIDEAHSIGIMGPWGKGVVASMGLLDQVDILVGTLSKTLGSQGGFVVGSYDLRELLVSKARSFIYTTSLSPACAGGALAALELLPKMEARRKAVLHSASLVRSRLQEMNWDTLSSESQIIPVMTGEINATKKLSDYLLKHGFFVPSIRPPTVPVGQGRVRLSITYDIVKEGLEPCLQTFETFVQTQEKGRMSVVESQ